MKNWLFAVQLCYLLLFSILFDFIVYLFRVSTTVAVKIQLNELARKNIIRITIRLEGT